MKNSFSIVYQDIKTIETDLGVSAKSLYYLSNNLKKHYKEAYIDKKDGTKRKLLIPDGFLKSIQRKIGKKILLLIPVSPYATAYRYSVGIRKNATIHLKKNNLLKVDIEDFFNNISYKKIKEKVFDKEHFSQPLRIMLSMLCSFNNMLPQGAPTSPAIANIILRDFDFKIGKWCKEHDVIYTRYCDDMIFSSDNDLKETFLYVKNQLLLEGFKLKSEKTRTINCHKRQVVTGVVVNDFVNTPVEYRKKIRQEIYYCKKFGVDEHIKRLNLKLDKKTYFQRLSGKINFAHYINPENEEMKNYKNWISSEIKKLKINA